MLRGFDIGGLTVFVNYSRQFSRPLNEIAMQVNTIFSALAGAERVFAVMDEAPEAEDAADAIAIRELRMVRLLLCDPEDECSSKGA